MEVGKQEVSLEVNIEKFSFADESKSERNNQQYLTEPDSAFLSIIL